MLAATPNLPLHLTPIGSIATPYQTLDACPANIEADGPECRLIIDPELIPALLGLSVGQRLLILYWFADAQRQRLQQPARQSREIKGVFALRTPHRPNPIAAATVTIRAIDGNIIVVAGLDCLDGTPLLDIKPAMAGEEEENPSSAKRGSKKESGRE